jgi:hypothetical protein
VLNILSLVAFVDGITRSSIRTGMSLYSNMPSVLMNPVTVSMEGVMSLEKLNLSV